MSFNNTDIIRYIKPTTSTYFPTNNTTSPIQIGHQHHTLTISSISIYPLYIIYNMFVGDIMLVTDRLYFTD